MTDPNHTPGPWDHAPASSKFEASASGDHVIYSADGTAIALVIHDGNARAADNAPIMTASPEMHAALKRARNMLQAVAGDIEDGYSLDSFRGKYVLALLGARDAADAALAKAEGKS